MRYPLVVLAAAVLIAFGASLIAPDAAVLAIAAVCMVAGITALCVALIQSLQWISRRAATRAP